jgi:hypothetical protein
VDRFTWAFVGGAIAVCVLGIASTFYVRAAASPSLDSPSGVVFAYLQAIHDHDADRAWGLLAPNATVGTAPIPEKSFRASVSAPAPGGSYSRLMRIAGSNQNTDTASVSVEASSSEGLGVSDTRELTFRLKKIDSAWKIDSAPSIFESK